MNWVGIRFKGQTYETKVLRFTTIRSRVVYRTVFFISNYLRLGMKNVPSLFSVSLKYVLRQSSALENFHLAVYVNIRIPKLEFIISAKEGTATFSSAMFQCFGWSNTRYITNGPLWYNIHTAHITIYYGQVSNPCLSLIMPSATQWTVTRLTILISV